MLYEFAPFEGLRNGEIKFLIDLWIRDRQKFYALVKHFGGKAQAIADHICVLVEGTTFGQEMPDEFAQHPGDFFVDMETVWTQFWDMHSGGTTKEPPYDKIYIEADEDEAYEMFAAVGILPLFPEVPDMCRIRGRILEKSAGISSTA